jgi:acyl-coenzyme A thioesterase PaaI-like protein
MNAAALFRKLSKYPFGKHLFSKLAARRAPYFQSISPFVEELTETSCIIILKKRRKVLNHIGTVHAIAVCNACEMAFGFTMEAGLPAHLRWIPKGMTVRYLKKCATDLTANCQFPQIKNLTPGDHVVPVTVTDTSGQLVFEADITVYVSDRPKK